jgi:hypothetical protein
LWWVFFQIGSQELFVWAGFQPWSSWSLPPGKLGLQTWATGTRLLDFYFSKFLVCLLLFEFTLCLHGSGCYLWLKSLDRHPPKGSVEASETKTSPWTETSHNH